MNDFPNNAYIINKGTQNFFYGTVHNINYYGKEKEVKKDNTKEEDFVQPMTELQATAKDWRDLLPQELTSEDAKTIFNKGIEKGLIISQGDKLKWTGNKRLLAYFAEKMCQNFNLSNKQDKDGNDTISWKPFEQLFNVNNLKSAKQAFMQLNTRFEPEGFEIVDKLFD